MAEIKKANLKFISKFFSNEEREKIDTVRSDDSYTKRNNVLMDAYTAWSSLDRFRENARRNKKYTFEDQWGDYVKVGCKTITERQNILNQGNVPLQNNRLRGILRSVVGVFQSTQTEPVCVALDREDQGEGEMMSTTLQYVYDLNRLWYLDSVNLQYLCFSGAGIFKSVYGKRNGKQDVWTDIVNYNDFFVDPHMKDPRGSQRNETNSTAIDAATSELIKQKNKALSSVNLEEFQDSIDWTTVFGNLDRISTNALEDIRGKLKTYLDEVGSSLSPTDLQTVTDAMEKMNIAIADRQPITELKTSYEDYKKALIEVIAAKEKLKVLEEGTEAYTKAAKELTEAEAARRTSLTTMSQSMNSFGQKGNELVNSGNEIIDMLSAFGVDVDENVAKTLAGVGQIMSGLQNIDLNKPFSIVTSSITILTGAGKAIAGVFGLFGGGDNNRYVKMKEQYDALNKVWDELISKKKEYISTSYGEEARKVGEEAKRLTEKQIESNRELGKAYMNSFKNKGGHSWGVRQQGRIDGNDWNDLAEWKKLNNISDELYNSATTGRMTGLFDLTAEQLESLKEEAPSLWAKLEDQTKEYLNNIIDGADSLEDINKSLKEQYTQISLDSFKDNYVDLLSDMDSSNQDLADNFEKYIQKAILSSLIGSKYKSQIESLYDDFADANSDGNIDQSEMEALKKKQEELAAQMLAERDKLKETFGWESDSSTSQDSTKGYSTTMTQDQAGEISGRMTGIYETNLRTEDNTAELVLLVSQNNSVLKGFESSFKDIRDIGLQSMYHLQDINKNTQQLYLVYDLLVSIEKNTKGLVR